VRIGVDSGGTVSDLLLRVDDTNGGVTAVTGAAVLPAGLARISIWRPEAGRSTESLLRYNRAQAGIRRSG
jgi:hypothetical protein